MTKEEFMKDLGIGPMTMEEEVIYNAEHIQQLIEFMIRHGIADPDMKICCVDIMDCLHGWAGIQVEMQWFLQNKEDKRDPKFRNKCLRNMMAELKTLGFDLGSGGEIPLMTPAEISESVSWLHDQQWEEINEICKPSLHAIQDWHSEHGYKGK